MGLRALGPWGATLSAGALGEGMLITAYPASSLDTPAVRFAGTRTRKRSFLRTCTTSLILGMSRSQQGACALQRNKPPVVVVTQVIKLILLLKVALACSSSHRRHVWCSVVESCCHMMYLPCAHTKTASRRTAVPPYCARRSARVWADLYTLDKEAVHRAEEVVKVSGRAPRSRCIG